VSIFVGWVQGVGIIVTGQCMKARAARQGNLLDSREGILMMRVFFILLFCCRQPQGGVHYTWQRCSRCNCCCNEFGKGISLSL